MLQIDSASIYYETAGSGQPIVFIHAGVADSRQWDREFTHFSKSFKVIRYDMRGFGNSDPCDGEFSHLNDLVKLLEHLSISQPVILVGCSMGGSAALDFALDFPDKVKALVLVDSKPSGLQLDLPAPAKFKLVEEAEEEGDLEQVAELETQIWFDGDRPTINVNQEMRSLVYRMNLKALKNDAKELGTQLPNSTTPAIERLGNIEVPVLGIVGESDISYMHAATEFMATKISNFQQTTIKNAAHLPNMDQPEVFQSVLTHFLKTLHSTFASSHAEN